MTTQATLFMGAFLLTFGLYLATTAAIWQQVPLPHSGLGLLVGNNATTGGTYTREDTVSYQSYPNIEEADRFARAEALRRIRANPRGFINRMGRKLVIYWTDGFYGPQYSIQKLPPGQVNCWQSPSSFT